MISSAPSLREKMNLSRSVVHSVEAPPLTDDTNNHGPSLTVRMKDIQGMPDTHGSLLLRVFLFVITAISLCVMASTSDFASATAFTLFVCARKSRSFSSSSVARSLSIHTSHAIPVVAYKYMSSSIVLPSLLIYVLVQLVSTSVVDVDEDHMASCTIMNGMELVIDIGDVKYTCGSCGTIM